MFNTARYDKHGIGTDYHCVHEMSDVRFRIVDWRPFSYFSAVEVDPLGSGLSYLETWEAVPDGDGIIVRSNVDAPYAGDDVSNKASGPEVDAIHGLYEAFGMPMLERLKAYLSGPAQA